MEINERFIKLSSRVPTSQNLQLGDDATIVIGNQTFVASVVKIEEKDNQDGTKDLIFNLKWLGE